MSTTDLTDTALRAGRLQAFLFPIVILVLNSSSVAVLWFGAGRIDKGQMQIGALIAFLSYLAQILMAVMMATFMVILVPRAAVCAERIVEVLDTPSSVVRAETPDHRTSQTAGRLELRDVGFHYPGAEAPVLTDISLLAEPGQVTAIIGSTGSGKTTLLSLIPRLFDVTSGAVLVDGVDVRDLDPDTLWGRIGLVPQKPYLFSGTVASNLRFADPDATDDELWAALEIAQATDFVRAMPGGLEAHDRPGRLQRVGRPAPASGHRPGARAQARDLPVRRLVLRARPGHRRPAAGRARAAHRRRHGHHRRPAGVDDHPRRSDPGARRRRVGRSRHPRRAARDLPDVSRDRRVADDRRGGGVTRPTSGPHEPDAEPDDDAVVRPPEARPQPAPGRSRAIGMPAEKSKDFGGSTKRLLGRMQRRSASSASRSSCFAVAQRHADRARAEDPRPRHRPHLQRASAGHRSIDFTALRDVLLTRPRPVRRRRRCCRTCSRTSLAGVVQRTMYRLRSDVEDKLNRLPLSYVDRQPRGDLLSRVTNDIDNVSQSLQQTLSQLLTSVLTLIGVLVMMFIISPMLALVARAHHPDARC